MVPTPQIPTPHGVLPVLVTPFTVEGEVEAAGLRREVDFVLGHGAHGVVLGLVSEVLRLSSEERDALAALTCEIVDGRVGVTVSVGAESTRTAVRHARAAQAAGASSVMAIPPLGTAADDGELSRYFSSIIESVDVPVVVQDASGYLGRPLSIDLQASLHARFGDHALFKPEAQPIGPRLTELLRATGGAAKIYEGTAGLALVDSHQRGIVGTMPGPDIVWALVALWNALEAGDTGTVARVQGAMSALVAMQNSLDSFVAVQKHLLRRQGVPMAQGTRGPVGYHLDEPTLREVDRLFDRLAGELGAAVDPRAA